jgi:hypothetical protein
MTIARLIRRTGPIGPLAPNTNSERVSALFAALAALEPRPMSYTPAQADAIDARAVSTASPEHIRNVVQMLQWTVAQQAAALRTLRADVLATGNTDPHAPSRWAFQIGQALGEDVTRTEPPGSPD